MGQQPNLPLSMEDLPRPEPHPAPPRRWQAVRPGDLGSPAEVPWGGAFGTPGPDTGYAMVLVAARRLAAAGGRMADAEAAVAALMAARASRLGRAPVAADAEVAELILGHREGGASAEAAARRRALGGGDAEGLRRLLESVDLGVLAAPVEEVRRRLAAGEGSAG